MFDEKRRTIRIKKRLQVQFGLQKADGTYHWDICLISDISESGMCLYMDNRLEKDTMCLLKIRIPVHPGEPIELNGKVINSSEGKTNMSAVRIQFLELSKEKQQYLREYIAWVLVNERGVK
jgi:hypothetical protein